uniref:NADH dehydrogenase subunit 6 n=1 Tax=Entricoplax vestita TaxID=2115857 RepID=UPI002E79E717|nr:NADH dehydrogenase subunit 6 [Entricoplax vestita]WRI34036.1 NADH dehydrogenase subunit 6 [Entricoplax vestita]
MPIILVLSFLFTHLTHPLSLGLTLLLQTVIISVATGIYVNSFWFSYILFMIFLGGMLVLFIYVASLASNEFFNFSLKTFCVGFTIFILMTFTMLLLDPLLTSHLSLIPTSTIMPQPSTPYVINWIYNNPSMIFTLFIVIYLLLTLIVVIKIINLVKSPLRLLN